MKLKMERAEQSGWIAQQLTTIRMDEHVKEKNQRENSRAEEKGGIG